MQPETDLGGRGRRFPSTHLSLFRDLREGPSEQRAAALQKLVLAYWKPVYCLIRYGWKRGNEEAKDLTQQFFLDTLVDGPVAEAELRAGLMASAGSYLPLVQRPMAGTMLVVAAAMFVWPFVREWRRAARGAARPPLETGPHTQGG